MEANEEIIISSPGINAEKVKKIRELVFRKQDSSVRVIIMTLSAEIYPETRIDKTRVLIKSMVELGIVVKEFAEMHEHFAVIDKQIVWYGSMNLLSQEKEDDNLMRVSSQEIAQELLELAFRSGKGKNDLHVECS